MAYGPGGASAMAGQGEDVFNLNMLKGKVVDKFRVHPTAVSSLALSSDGQSALTSDEHGNIMYWNLDKRKPRAALVEHGAGVAVMAFSPDCAFAASGDVKGTTILWRLEKRKERLLVNSDWSEKVTALAFSLDSSLLIAAGERGRVQVWEVDSGSMVKRFSVGEVKAIQDVRFFNNATACVAAIPSDCAGACFPRVYKLDINTGKHYDAFRPASKATTIPHCVLLDLTCRNLLIAGRVEESSFDDDYRLDVWKLAGAEPLHRFSELKGKATCMAVSGDSRIAVAVKPRPLQVFTMPAE